MRVVQYQDLGNIAYDVAWDYQESLLQKNLMIKAAWYHNTSQPATTDKDTTDYLLFCEHPHVYTLGKSGHLEHLLVNDSRMKELNVAFFHTNRGGDITYHGPGQIVGYPILDLEHYGTDLGKYMRNLEEVIIRSMRQFGIDCGRLQGSTGVWIDADVKGRSRKICAMGVRCSRWVTMHGFALNVNTDLKYFDYIVPCGITDKSVTSIERELGEKVDIDAIKEVLRSEFENVFEVAIVEHIITEAV